MLERCCSWIELRDSARGFDFHNSWPVKATSMGADPWQFVGPYDPDPTVALRLAQREFFEMHFDLPTCMDAVVKDAQECVAAVDDDDEFGLMETYTTILRDVRKIAETPIPDDRDEQIQLLRKLINATGEPLNNILDVEEVSATVKVWCVSPLSRDEIKEYFGTDSPAAADVDIDKLYSVYTRIDRAQTVCFPIHSESDPNQPVQMMYVGYTAD